MFKIKKEMKARYDTYFYGIQRTEYAYFVLKKCNKRVLIIYMLFDLNVFLGNIRKNCNGEHF